MQTLELIGSYAEEDRLLEGHIRRLHDARPELAILEAGCGPSWPLRLDGIRYRLTGVDLDRAALAYRSRVVGDLDEAVLGDLRTVHFAAECFDVIYNAFVLEHIRGAAPVLERFAAWLKPGGLLILKIPDRDTVFGFVTRVTPFWFHLAYHKYVLGRPRAGKPGFGPYPTVYDPVISRAGIREFCRAHRFEIVLERGLGTYCVETHARARLIRFVAIGLSAMSFGRLPWRHNNLTYVLRKPGPA